jgi:hypothetical protein
MAFESGCSGRERRSVERTERGGESYEATYGTEYASRLIWLECVWSIAGMGYLQKHDDEMLDT